MSYDAATRARLVGIFVAEAEETIAALRAHAPRLAGDGGSAAEFGRVAHGLKGAAASLGYDGLSRALHGLEDLALGIRRGGVGGARARLDAVSLSLDLLAEGVARMAASGADAPPSDVVDMLLEALGTEGEAEVDAEAEAPAEDAATAPRAPRGGEARAEEGGVPRAGEGADRMSVPAADVDTALRLASSAARAAAQLHEALLRGGDALAGAAQSLAATTAGLEGVVASLRLLPAEVALDGLEEEVGALAASLGKQAAVEVRGRDVRADRRTLQTARGMIRHLVRNALDHGLEAAEARALAGKPREGRLTIALDAGESTLRVRVADDGAGFDLPAIRAALAARSDGERIASLSDDEVLEAWALDGGSTRATATRVSGRGLGLSAVARLARAAGGGLRVRSVRGEGSTVEFTLPLEVYAVEALTVAAAGRTFAIPLAAVERTVHVAAAGDAIHDGPTGRTLAVGETILPLGALSETLGVPRRGAERFAVVVRSDAALAAFAVEEIGAVEGMVPASVPGVAEAEALVTGLARLGDGGAVAVLNPRLLVARARATRAVPRAAAPAEAPRPEAASPRPARALDVVLAEDSLATREVLRVLLEEQGFRVRVAADGEEALERVRERAPDVLVSDVNMPRRDGLSLTRALRAFAATERLPIVLLTSQDDDAMRAAGAAAGADAYLVKSRFNAQVLEETLARIGLRAR